MAGGVQLVHRDEALRPRPGRPQAFFIFFFVASSYNTIANASRSAVTTRAQSPDPASYTSMRNMTCSQLSLSHINSASTLRLEAARGTKVGRVTISDFLYNLNPRKIVAALVRPGRLPASDCFCTWMGT